MTVAISKLKSGLEADPRTARPAAWIAVLVIILATGAAYSGSLAGPFVFDDAASIRDNATLRQLWPLPGPLTPPVGNAATVTGRPLLNLSLAVNYAFGGLNVGGYHATNLAIHIGAALALFGVVRRTLARVGTGGSPVRDGIAMRTERTDGRAARPYLWVNATAFMVALLWAVHPLQTEAVTYVVQRAESLMGLFYLLTFYGFIRSVDGLSWSADRFIWSASEFDRSADRFIWSGSEFGRSAGAPSGRAWAGLSIFCCLLGMLTKEVTVTAPVLVWLYDRTFVSGSFREAWRRRRVYYSLLAGTWLVLAAEMAITGGNRGGSVGFGSGTAWWDYALTQFPAITTYLRLSLWPHPLVFDYGTAWVPGLGAVLPQAILVAGLVGATLWALRQPRWAGAGFLGAWFFAILAPTSLVPGTTQMIVEHRMYLPLAAVLVGVVLAGEKAYALLFPRAGPGGFLALGLALAVAGGIGTAHRNANYRSELSLWADTAAKRPDNARAQNNLGIFLVRAGRPGDAVAAYRQALRSHPDFTFAENNLGIALVEADRPAEAIAHYGRALQLKPDFAEAENNLGIALAKVGRTPEAMTHYQTALRLKPDYAECHYNFGNALVRTGRLREAVREYTEALRLAPDNAEAECNLGSALLELGQPGPAILHYEAACRIDPAFGAARANLEMARQQIGQKP